MNYRIPFNRPFLVGKELTYIQSAIESGKLSGNGRFTQLCQNFFTDKYQFKKNLLTTSCTDALEMAALLLELSSGDEVILPSFTFVSTANAFALRNCELKFADTLPDVPNMDPEDAASLITPRTKAIVLVHYAGIACQMDHFRKLASKHNLYLIEDCAQAIDAAWQGVPLGSFGEVSAFSFHETKNIIAGEGGMLAINKPELFNRAEILWEKGTNRAAFFRGEVDRYNWVDLGSSFLPSELTAAFLYAQLEQLALIQQKRLKIWNRYFESFRSLEEQGKIQLSKIPPYASNNGHMFYVLCASLDERQELIQFMKDKGIYLAFHYVPLHNSPFFSKDHRGRELPHTQRFSERLVRLPLFFDLSESDQDQVIKFIHKFYS